MGIKVVLSDKEASSKVLEPIPSGWYTVTITDVEMKESKSVKNAGKPYYSVEHTVAEGKYEGRKLFSNVMLFEGALYTAVQLVAALTGEQPEPGELEVPEADELIGEQVLAKVKIQPERTVKDDRTGESKTYERRNEVAGYKALSAGAETQASKSSSLLPS
jgi:uncharacterized protein DUF669